MEVLGGGRVDTDKYFILDKQLDRCRLGHRVVSLEFAARRSTKRKALGGEVPRMGQQALGGVEAATIELLHGTLYHPPAEF